MNGRSRIVAYMHQMPAYWYYLGIVIASLIANWFVQLGYFIYMTDRNPLAFGGERTLADYTTGFIGDAVLLPIMNAAILYVAIKAQPKLCRRDIFYIVPFGIAADVLLHFMQGYLKLTNWSMPAPFQWDFVSYWHMISFFFQISFVFLFFYLVLRRRFTQDTGAVRAVYAVFGLIMVFIMLFLYDYLPVGSILHSIHA